MWLTLSVGGMFLTAAVRVLQKGFVSRNPTINAFRINWLVFAVSMPIVAVIIIQNFHTILHLQTAFWVVLAAVVLGFYPAVNYLFFSVIRRNELSDVMPLLGLVPILTALFGWMFLNQRPSRLALVGIVLISASIYCLQLQLNKTWYAPFQALAKAYSARAMGVVSLITAISAIGDKFAITRSSSSIYFALNSLGALLVLLIADLLLTGSQPVKVHRKLNRLPASQWWLLILLGIVQLVGQIVGFAATHDAAITSYSIAIRNLSIVIASLLALVLYRESVNRYKFLSYGLSALGVVMITL